MRINQVGIHNCEIVEGSDVTCSIRFKAVIGDTDAAANMKSWRSAVEIRENDPMEESIEKLRLFAGDIAEWNATKEATDDQPVK